MSKPTRRSSLLRRCLAGSVLFAATASPALAEIKDMPPKFEDTKRFVYDARGGREVVFTAEQQRKQWERQQARKAKRKAAKALIEQHKNDPAAASPGNAPAGQPADAAQKAADSAKDQAAKAAESAGEAADAAKDAAKAAEASKDAAKAAEQSAGDAAKTAH